MRRLSAFLVPALLALAMFAAGTLVTTTPASAAPIAGAPTTNCGDPVTDGSMSTGAGTMITCDTTITNTITAIDPITGVSSGTSVVTVIECVGPASGRTLPTLTCTTDTEAFLGLVTTIDQCNGVGYGGGNVLDCNVDVVNDFDGVTPLAITAATVNQCNTPQAAAPSTAFCTPYPADALSPTIAQCNNSSYGGGQEDFICGAIGSTTTASLTVTVRQCNNSNYGGGSWLTCSTSLTNNIVAAAETPTPTLSPTPSPTLSPTPSPTLSPTPSPTPELVVLPLVAPVVTPAPTSSALAAPIGAVTVAAATPGLVAPAPSPSAAVPPVAVGVPPSMGAPVASNPLIETTIVTPLPDLPDTSVTAAAASLWGGSPAAVVAIAFMVAVSLILLQWALAPAEKPREGGMGANRLLRR